MRRDGLLTLGLCLEPPAMADSDGTEAYQREQNQTVRLAVHRLPRFQQGFPPKDSLSRFPSGNLARETAALPGLFQVRAQRPPPRQRLAQTPVGTSGGLTWRTDWNPY